jgi:hypothetical protein
MIGLRDQLLFLATMALTPKSNERMEEVLFFVPTSVELELIR